MPNKFIIYGNPGCGKTTYVCCAKTGVTTIPEAQPVLYIDFDEKVKVVQSNVNRLNSIEWDNEKIIADKINVLSFPYTSDTVLRAFTKIESLLRALEDSPFKTIVVDSATSLSELLMQYTLKTSTTKRANANVLGLQDYQIVGNIQGRIVHNILNSGKHVILICHTRVETFNESATIRKEEPMFVGQMARASITGKVDYGGYYTVDKKGKHTIQWDDPTNVRWGNQSMEIGVDEPLPTEVDFSQLAYLFE